MTAAETIRAAIGPHRASLWAIARDATPELPSDDSLEAARFADGFNACLALICSAVGDVGAERTAVDVAADTPLVLLPKGAKEAVERLDLWILDLVRWASKGSDNDGWIAAQMKQDWTEVKVLLEHLAEGR